MKKMHGLLIMSVFLMSSFLAMNLYNAASFPGFGGSETCNNCHNQPIFARTVDMTFTLGDWANSATVFEDEGLWSTNEVPVIQVNNRSEPIEFMRTQFLTNSTHFAMMMEISDTTPTNSTTSTASTSDKFAVIFNIDSVNFTVGDFLNYYNSSETNLNAVIDGQMGLDDGSADMWWIDTATTNFNSTGKALDYYILSNYLSDGSSAQDVYYALWWGLLAVHGPTQVWGYRLWFVRTLTNSDSHDVQFNDGEAVRYAIATWNNDNNEFHQSSFDQMLIVGDQIAAGMTQTVTSTKIETTTVTGTGSTSGTASAFTVVFVLAGLVISVPVISKYRHRRE